MLRFLKSFWKRGLRACSQEEGALGLQGSRPWLAARRQLCNRKKLLLVQIEKAGPVGDLASSLESTQPVLSG